MEALPQVVLTQDIQGLGVRGEITKATYGYFRNFLQPQKLAVPLTDDYLQCAPGWAAAAVLVACRPCWLQLPGARRKLDREEKAKQQAYSRGVAKAQSMATALRTIGKFTITKRAGDGGKIFGRHARAHAAPRLLQAHGRRAEPRARSVTPDEVIDAIYAQIGQKLDKAALDLPAMKTTGTHQASIQLHPDVIGRFSIVINKAKQGK